MAHGQPNLPRSTQPTSYSINHNKKTCCLIMETAGFLLLDFLIKTAPIVIKPTPILIKTPPILIKTPPILHQVFVPPPTPTLKWRIF